VRLNNRWMIAGAALGLALAFGIQGYAAMMRGHLPPVLMFLFWPSGFIASFYYPTAPLLLPAILVNALLFAAVGAILRSRSLLVLAALIIVAWWVAPPSESRLSKQFTQHRASLQHLVDISEHESGIVRITADEVGNAEGQIYRFDDEASRLTEQHWSEYRQMIRDINVTELAFGREKSGEVFAFSKTPTLGIFRTSYGYLYCPETWDKPIFFVPCSRGGNSGDSHAYHYQRVDRNWYIYEVFEPQRIE